MNLEFGIQREGRGERKSTPNIGLLTSQTSQVKSDTKAMLFAWNSALGRGTPTLSEDKLRQRLLSL